MLSSSSLFASVQNPSILTILNDPARANMYELLAKQMGVQVFHAEGALHALTQLERTKVHAIICDAQMPDMTGAEFCSIVEGDAITRRLPVYLIPNSAQSLSTATWYTSVAAGPEILSRVFRQLGLDQKTYPIPINSEIKPQLDGAVNPFTLADFLNWVAELGFSGHWMVTVKPANGGAHTGHIAMNAGKIIYAEFGGCAGKKAILMLLKNIDHHTQSEFSFFRSEPIELTETSEFTQSTARLLIEMAVDFDEDQVRAS